MSAGITALWLGEVEYRAAWDLQRELADARADGRIGDILLLLEHPPTITLGRAHDPAHVLAGPDRLAELGISVVQTDRGGDVTYHGPGQIVGYPIMQLDGEGRDLHGYLRRVEEALIRALARLGMESQRKPPHTGVWVGDRKIAAIGIKVSRWVTHHGFALNVSADLSAFGHIVPCGIHEFSVTSLCHELDIVPSIRELLPIMAGEFACVFGMTVVGQQHPISGLSDSAQRLLASAELVLPTWDHAAPPQTPSIRL